MRTVLIYKGALAFFIFAHLCVSLVVLPIRNISDAFPFFTWELYAYVGSERQINLLKVIEVNGSPVDKWLHDTTLISQREEFRKVMTLIREITQDDSDRLKKLNGILSQSGMNLIYEIHRTRLNPVAFLTDRQIIDTRVVGRFSNQ